MILYIENAKESTHKTKLLEQINESRMIAGYKINIQKPITVLYTHNGQSENGLRKFHLQ